MRKLTLDGQSTHFPYECSHCGVLLKSKMLANAADLVRVMCFEAPHQDSQIACDIYTLRTLATKFGLAAYPSNSDQSTDLVQPHGERRAEAKLSPLRALGPSPVSVGIMCCRTDLQTVLETAAAFRGWAAEVVILVDESQHQGKDSICESDGFLSVYRRELAGHFAAQRNALQQLCRANWVFQLDADEWISSSLGSAIASLATLADMQGAVSVGFARRNYVDGELSDLYPDVQYRLNRREIPFVGKVHERPDRSWQSSFIALCGDINHHLSAEYVAKRSQAYDGLDPGNGRAFEAQSLMLQYSGL